MKQIIKLQFYKEDEVCDVVSYIKDTIESDLNNHFEDINFCLTSNIKINIEIESPQEKQ